jgi:hypothetical protein
VAVALLLVMPIASRESRTAMHCIAPLIFIDILRHFPVVRDSNDDDTVELYHLHHHDGMDTVVVEADDDDAVEADDDVAAVEEAPMTAVEDALMTAVEMVDLVSSTELPM